MGKIIQTLPLGNIQGTLGDIVFVHCADGRILARRRPPPRTEFTAGELRSQGGLRLGVAYVRKLKANPDAYAAYKSLARELRKRACDLAISDFLSPPDITDVDLAQYSGRAGEKLFIQAIDRTEVISVTVTITDGNEILLEQGTAVLGLPPATWIYTVQRDVAPGQVALIHATASDRAGNMTTKSLFHPIGGMKI